MKKQLLTFLLLLPACLAIHAQYDRDTAYIDWMGTTYVLNFDNPNPDLIEFDPPENNVWQIGKPNKEPFAPFTGTGAIMTDTSHMLDSALEHSFILKFHRLEESNAVREWWVQFMQNYEFDSLVSGGYISVSYDKGVSWKNVVYDDSTGSMAMLNLLYDSTSAKINAQPILTGSGVSLEGHPSSVGKFFSCTIWDAVWVYDIWVKFTYINTGKNNPHAGWMIDYFYFSIDSWCEYIYNDIGKVEITEIGIYPNPAKKQVVFNYPETSDTPLTLEVYDLIGHKVFQRTGICGTTETVGISHLPNGSYLYHLYNNTNDFKGQFIIQK